MTTTPKRFRIGSAAVVCSIFSVLWFMFALVTIAQLERGNRDASLFSSLKYAVIFTAPLLVATAIAALVRNSTGSEGTAWLAALGTIVIAVLVGFSMVSRVALSFS